MPIFEIQSKDGKTYEVDAPDINRAASTISKMGNENRKSFGDAFSDLSQDENLKSGLQTKADKMLVGEGSSLGGFIDSGANSMLLGAPRAIAAGLDSLVSGKPYAETHERYKEASSANQRLHPYASGAGTGAGIVGQALILPIGAPPSIGGRLALGVGVGGGISGAESLIENRGDLGQAAKDTAMGMAGGLAGGGLFELGRGIYHGGKAFGSAVANTFGKADKRAPIAVNRALSGQDSRQVSDYLTQNPGAVLADAGGKQARDLLRTSTNMSPEGHELATNVLGQRASQESQALHDVIGGTLGGGQSKLQATEAIKNASRKGTADLYKQSYSEAPNVWDEGLERFSRSEIGQEAIKGAHRKAQQDYAEAVLRGEKPEAPRVPIEINIGGTEARVARGKPVGLEFWDKTKQALDDMYEKAEKYGSADEARRIDKVRSALLEKMDAASATYKKARGSARDSFADQKAVKEGAESLTKAKDPRDIDEAFYGLDPEDSRFFKGGQGTELQKRVINENKTPRDGGNFSVVNRVFDPETQRRAELGLNDEAKGELGKSLNFWRNAAETRGALGGSPTARNLAQMGIIGGGLGATGTAFVEPDQVANASIVGALLGGAKYYSASQKAKLGKEITKLLVSNNFIPEKAMKDVSKSKIAELLFKTLPVSAAAGSGYLGQKQ